MVAGHDDGCDARPRKRALSHAGVPSGTVQFVIDGIVRVTVDLTNGVASLFLQNGLAQGSHTVVLKYAGSGSHAASNTTFILNLGGRTG